jgi:hypothetical protein
VVDDAVDNLEAQQVYLQPIMALSHFLFHVSPCGEDILTIGS